MSDRIIFRAMLSEIKELAEENGNRLTREQIRDFFRESNLTQEQLEMVTAYLAGEKIQIEGYEKKQEAADTVLDGEQSQSPESDWNQRQNTGAAGPGEEEKKEAGADAAETQPMEIYREELQHLETLSQAERLNLFWQAAAGEQTAKSSLTHAYLQTVYDLSKTYLYDRISQGDLVQEGNVGLLLALEELTPGQTLEEYEQFLFNRIQEAMEDAVQESQDLEEMGEKLAKRADQLKEAAENLKEELGRKVSIEELSAYLEMPMEEIKDILRMAGDEIQVTALHKEE